MPRVRRGMVLALERDHAAAVPVQSLAAGQAPGPVHRLAARAADPEAGRVLPAVDAQLDGVWQLGRHGSRAQPCPRLPSHADARLGCGDGASRGRHRRVRDPAGGSDRVAAATAGTAAWRASGKPAPLVKLASDRQMRWMWFMMISCRGGADGPQASTALMTLFGLLCQPGQNRRQVTALVSQTAAAGCLAEGPCAASDTRPDDRPAAGPLSHPAGVVPRKDRPGPDDPHTLPHRARAAQDRPESARSAP